MKFSGQFPSISQFARQILPIPPTSASIERVFSFGGRVLRPERRRLNNDIFEKIMFNKLNRKVLSDV
jgi:hypothetical protein